MSQPTPKPPTPYGPYQCPFDGALLHIADVACLRCATCGATGRDQEGMVQPRPRPPLPPVPDLAMNDDPYGDAPGGLLGWAGPVLLALAAAAVVTAIWQGRV
jgi:hypothetical protein